MILSSTVLTTNSPEGGLMKTAYEVAQFFLHHAHDGEKDQISHLKLQKLLYYAQGYSLAFLDRPIFDEPIECWQHGPVVKTIYHAYKHYGRKPIPPAIVNLQVFSNEEVIVLSCVANEYGQHSAWKLRNMTHCEEPWRLAKSEYCSDIPVESIKRYFKDKLEMPEVRDDNHAYQYDVGAIQASIDSGAVRVPELQSDDDFIAWLNA